MQVVILAGGAGTRLRPLTNDRPKTLVDVCGKPILSYILDALPTTINEIIIVHDYLGDMIVDTFGHNYNGIPARYIRQDGLRGTAGALWSARSFLLTRQPFLVLNGDDIYNRSDLTQLVRESFALGLHPKQTSNLKTIIFELDVQQRVIGHRHPTPEELTQPISIATGAYVLDDRIFLTEPVQLPNGEYGLPQTLLAHLADWPLIALPFESWHQINTLADLQTAHSKIGI